MMTVDRHRLIFSCVHWDQFIFLIAEDDPMRCPRMDHFGFSVAAAPSSTRPGSGPWRSARSDDRVDIVDPAVDDQGVVKIHSIYLGYLLPMMVRAPVLGVRRVMNRRVAVVGVALSDIGRIDDLTPYHLHAQAVRRAMADAGLDQDDVDGFASHGTGA